MSFIKRFRKNGKTYLAEVESQWVDGKVKTKYIKYLGKEADGKTILSSSVSNITVQKIKLFGPLLLLNHLAKEISVALEDDFLKHAELIVYFYLWALSDLIEEAHESNEEDLKLLRQNTKPAYQTSDIS